MEGIFDLPLAGARDLLAITSRRGCTYGRLRQRQRATFSRLTLI
ncbi:hypothetical protein [Chamaesiphon sp. GL140_3_metabinner_50]|nr:hypothetical protein [Chamaesiphon sp. GL140_3_metabinner_50]